ncbi:hypothetical protein HJ203_22570 [Vibrio parahaemolyticus]|nr:hypothetical protein [Vibrio parahaemolyticus]MBE4173942.1 hypothetical protein [Vibrio parahaemolyticus]MBM5014420.1 hypothetical protein [Vibrio parahaemolyticus]HBC3588196.1 hypothetical protein [Vibrio parahaemolyticus]
MLENEIFKVILAICSLAGGLSSIITIYDFMRKRITCLTVLLPFFMFVISVSHGLGLTYGLLNSFDFIFMSIGFTLSFSSLIFPGIAVSIWCRNKGLAVAISVTSILLVMSSLMFSFLSAHSLFPSPVGDIKSLSANFWFVFISLMLLNITVMISFTKSAKNM